MEKNFWIQKYEFIKKRQNQVVKNVYRVDKVWQQSAISKRHPPRLRTIRTLTKRIGVKLEC